MHEPHAVLELRLFVRGRELECTLEIVEHRDELTHQPLVGARGQLLLVARHPLAVVVELGLQTLQRVEVLVTLARDRLELIGAVARLRRAYAARAVVRFALGLVRGAAGKAGSSAPRTRLVYVAIVRHLSSTTSYSASSTTSSSFADDSPSPDGCCCSCADAFAYSACAASVHACWSA